jgi:hypothetical protein
MKAVPQEDACIFQQWKKDFQQLAQLRVPRWLGSTDIRTGELHLFSDSSELAYGTVAYRINGECTEAQGILVASKNRVAPTKALGIPRLELLACVIGVRLAQTILTAWNAPELKVNCWSDSQVALQWIAGPALKRKVFVAHRVQEIQSHSQWSQWRYCLSKENPADLLTRRKKLQELQAHLCWWRGPSWLGKEEDWPVQPERSQRQKELIEAEGKEVQVKTEEI